MKLQPNSPENCISSGLSSKKRRPSSDRIGRRLTAMLLVTAMAMGMSVGLLASADDQIYPPAVQSVDEFPTLTIETNLVKSELTGEPEIEVVEKDADGNPTKQYGFVEVALRVKPGLNGTDLIPFIEAGVTLAYEKNILEPITWNYDGNGTDETEKLDTYDVIEFVDPDTGTPIDPLDAAPLSVNFPAKKTDLIHTGAAFVGGRDEGADDDGDTEDYVAFSLYAEAQRPTLWSGDRAPVMLEGDSRLVVVRFRYDAMKYQMTYDETETDATQKIKIFDLVNSVDIPSKHLITWANYTNAAASPTWNNARYVGGEDAQSEMYYIHSVADPALWTDTDSDNWPDVLATWTTDTDGDGQVDPPATAADCYFLKAVLPDTSGGTSTTTFSLREDLTDDPYAVGQDAYAVSGDTYTTWSTRAASTATYSYTTNFFPVHDDWCDLWGLTPDERKIRFTQICALTADQGTGGISLDDIAVVLFYDWDDTLLGTLLVPRGMDVREDVNAYVRDHFIHPDLRYDAADTAPNLALIDNTSRINSYRGTFPHDTPGDDEFTGNYVTDGEDYPLTNKLDYTFFKRPMSYDEGDLAVDGDESWNLNITDFPDGYDADYPYAYGWAVTEDATEVTNLWTTLGAGELSAYTAGTGTATLTVSDADFEFQLCDFTSVDTSAIYAKAVYEPGAEMKTNQYTAADLYYTRYGTAASNQNGTYSIQFTYDRVNGGFGVPRMRSPSVRTKLTPDVDGASSFLQEVSVENTERIQVNITPSSGVAAVSYVLAENYGYANFADAGTRSSDDLFGVQYNFDPDAATADQRGTDGFVFHGSMGILLEQGTLQELGEDNNFSGNLTQQLFMDLNLWRNATSAITSAAYANQARRSLTTAFTDAYALYGLNEQGVIELTWHQIQYAILNGGAVVDKSTAELENYSWYRGPAL